MHSGKAAGPSLQGHGATERGTCVTSTAGSHRDFKGGNIGVCCEAPSGGGLMKEQNVWAVQRAGALSANLDRDEATATGPQSQVRLTLSTKLGDVRLVA